MVGSGPAGIACATALVARGFAPIVLDGGRRLERGRATQVADACEAGVGGFDSALVAELRDAFPVDVDKLPLKPVYGSTYAYAPDCISADNVGAVPSEAVGGLSAVWGAAMLPYAEREHDDWPFARETLEPHYRAVLGFVPLAGEHDSLEASYPLYAAPRELRPTPQIASVLTDLRRNAGRLSDAGLVGGRARLAVWAEENPHGRPCALLGQCMLGCPYRAIYGTEQTLDHLLRDGKVVHRPGVLVRRFEAIADGVRLHTDAGPVDGDRVFIAAGPLATARIVLASLAEHDRPVRMLDSAYYTFPALRLARAQRVSAANAGNTLAQVFLELDDRHVSQHPVHLQLYGFNDLMLRALAARAHLPEPAAERLFQPLLARLLYVQGYLHSSESPAILLTLTQSGELHAVGERTPATREAVRRVVRKLASLRRLTRLEPVAPMVQVWAPGKGFHVGGAFPMRERPGEHETDVLGRLRGYERVHLVDASVFPSLPATTITLTVMANAHRIGSRA